MNRKYYQRLMRGNAVRPFDVKVCCNELRIIDAEDLGLVITHEENFFRPITPPCWLPIGDKKEFEDGTLFCYFSKNSSGKLDSEFLRSVRVYGSHTHYLPPLPVLDGTQDKDWTLEQYLRERLKIANLQLYQVNARISELEESIRKEREAHQWKKLSEFEGEELPKNCAVTGRSKQMTILQDCYAKQACMVLGYTHYQILSDFKPDNSEKIKELEIAIEHMRAMVSESALAPIYDELAKLKEEGR